MIEFSATFNTTVQLACYPPYHSKYNPIERVFGVLENYWNGDPLRTIEKALQMASNMTYKKVHPSVSFIEKKYDKGVRLAVQQMKKLESFIERHSSLGKWFVIIRPEKALAALQCLNP